MHDQRSRRGLIRGGLALLLAGAAAISAAVAGAPTAMAHVGDGFKTYGDATRASLPHYTVRLTSTIEEAALRDGLRNAISQIEAATSTRITLAAGRTQATASPPYGEIHVIIGTTYSACGSTDGCGAITRLTNNNGFTYNASGLINLRASVFEGTTAFQRSMIAHELGHTLGLDHSDDSAQLMHGTVTSADGGTYKAGDIRGLQYLARSTPGAPSIARSIALDAPSERQAFYADASGELRHSYWDATAGEWRDTRLHDSAIHARTGSPIVSNEAGTQVFFVSTANRLANSYYSDGAWATRYLSGDDVQVQAGSDLELANGKLYFVSAAGTLHNAYWSNSRWNFAGLNNDVRPRAGSALEVNDASTQLFFVSTTNRLANAYYSNGQWQTAHLTGDDVAVRGGSDLALANGKVFFQRSDGTLYNAYWSNSRWNFAGIHNGVVPLAGSPIETNENATQVFFVSTQNRVANAYYSAGAWDSRHLTNDDRPVTPGSDLALSDGHVFFVNANSKLEHAYYTTRWEFSTIGGWPGS